MDENINNVVVKAERAVNLLINSMLPLPTCAEKRAKALKVREKVKSELAAKLVPLSTVGPSQIK